MMKDPFWQKIAATLVAVGIYLIAHRFPDIAAELGALAGGLAGGMWWRRPGDVALEEAKK